MKLRPYQVQAHAATFDRLKAGINRQLLQQATGTGKTVGFTALFPKIKPWIERHHKRARMLVMAHREEILDQTVETFRAMAPGHVVMVEQADRYANSAADIVVASVLTLAGKNCRRLRRLMADGPFGFVVCDEAQHGIARSYRRVFAELGFLPPDGSAQSDEIEAATAEEIERLTAALNGWDAVAPKDRLLLGVTATPNRADAVGLGCVFQEIVFKYPLRQAISDGWLVDIVPWSIETGASLDDVHVRRGEFVQSELSGAVNTPERNEVAVASWFEHAEGRPTVAFAVDVQHAEDLAAAFVARGVRAVAVSGDTPSERRREIKEQFLAGDITMLCNCQVYTEGTDLPPASCILMARPTKSATLFEQMVGRGLRLHPGKSDAVVLDLVDVARKHSLVSAASLYGLPPGVLVKGEKLGDVADEIERLEAMGLNVGERTSRERKTLRELGAMSRTFNIWDVKPLDPQFEAWTHLGWIKMHDGLYRLSYPVSQDDAAVSVAERVDITINMLGTWDAACYRREKPEGGVWSGPVMVEAIGAGFATAAQAGKRCEVFMSAKRKEAFHMRDRNARWRGMPASSGQVDALRRFGFQVPREGLTKGRASDLLDLAIANRRRAS